MSNILYFFHKRLSSPNLLLVLMVTIPLCLFGQASRIDSLTKALGNSSGLDRIDVQIELARANYFIDVNLALDHINNALEAAERADDQYRILKSNRIKGQILRRLERLDDAIKVYESAYNLFKSSVGKASEIDEEFVNVLNSLGLAYSLAANYDKALDLHFQALVLREKTGDLADISISYNNIGFVYFKLKNYEKSLEYYKKSLEVKTAVRDSFDLDHLHVNIGLCYVHLKDFDKALETFNTAFKVCGKNCSDQILMEGEGGLGVAYYWLGDYDKAQKYFMSGRDRAIKVANQRFLVEPLVYLARIALKKGEIEKVRDYLTECEKISAEIGYNQLLMDVYREYANLYTQSNDFQQASIYQNKYITLKDSLIGEELVKNIARTQTQFEERENLRTIELKDEALARQRMLNLSIGTIAFLGVLLVFILYQNNKTRKRVNAKLSDAYEIIEAQNRKLQVHADNLQAEVNKATADLLVANTSLQKVNEDLDNFIYKTSHDIRGPLASLRGMCNIALIDVKDEQALTYLKTIDSTASHLNKILTRLVIINQINNATINPEPLDFDKIVDDVILFENKKGLPKGFTFKRDIQRNIIFRSDDVLIRIILENLIDNAVKFHNNSERVVPFAHIKIFTEAEHLHIQVIDNGVGIVMQNPNKIFQMFTRASERSGTGGVGLYLIKQAVTRLGGEVRLQLTPEKYTLFHATLPLEIPKELMGIAEEPQDDEAKTNA
ncbi:MAG: tetratricopeptide repeat protein [Cyclobacteriaceae bacterium]|nr:tetratricopeptide repeat protein [Cyclobacteriaceae bacterium]